MGLWYMMSKKQGQVFSAPPEPHGVKQIKFLKGKDANHTKGSSYLPTELDFFISFIISLNSDDMCETKFYKYKPMWSWLSYYKLLLMLSQISCENTHSGTHMGKSWDKIPLTYFVQGTFKYISKQFT